MKCVPILLFSSMLSVPTLLFSSIIRMDRHYYEVMPPILYCRVSLLLCLLALRVGSALLASPDSLLLILVSLILLLFILFLVANSIWTYIIVILLLVTYHVGSTFSFTGCIVIHIVLCCRSLLLFSYGITVRIYQVLPALLLSTCVPALLLSCSLDRFTVFVTFVVVLFFIVTLLFVVANSIWTYVVIIYYWTYVIIIFLLPMILSYFCSLLLLIRCVFPHSYSLVSVSFTRVMRRLRTPCFAGFIIVDILF